MSSDPETFCPGCEEYHPTEPSVRDETYTVRGVEITVPVQVRLCVNCGESIGTDADDQATINRVMEQYNGK